MRYDLIAQAARALRCPVLANGNVQAAGAGADVLARTGARGLMIGRGAIRNPWLFQQIRQRRRGETATLPTGRDVLAYIRELWDSKITPGVRESAQVQRMKKFMNFIGEGVSAGGTFSTRNPPRDDAAGFFPRLRSHLDHDRLTWNRRKAPAASPGHAGIVTAKVDISGVEIFVTF